MSSYFWFLLLLTVTAVTSECPQNCICSSIRNQQTPHHDHAKCTMLNDVNGNFATIHSLDLSSINLDSIPVELKALQNVTHLDLSKNHLTTLTKLSNRIRSLDLSHNRLPSSELVKIPSKIRILNLSYNQITHLPLDIMNFKSLKSINLIGNRIDCSCETLTIRDWLHRNNVWMNKHTICASPLEARHQPWDKISKSKLCSIDEQIKSENKIEYHHRTSRELELSDFIAEEFLPFESHSILKRQVPIDDSLNNSDNGSGNEEVPENLEYVIESGSGEGSGTDVDIGDVDVGEDPAENVSPEEYDEEPDEGSGSGYGILPLDIHPDDGEENHTTEEPTDFEESTRKPFQMDIYEGLRNNETTVAPVEAVNEEIIERVRAPIIDHGVNTAPIGQQPTLDQPDDLTGTGEETKKPAESRNTYILLTVLGLLLVSLIVYVVFKRRKNRRRSSYNNNDAENAREIEMLDMKKNSNGKQPNAEIVPLMPKNEQPKIEKGMDDQNKEINSNIQPLHATTYPKVDTVPAKQNDVPETTDALPENNNNFSEIQPEPSQTVPKTTDEMDDNTAKKPIQNGHNGYMSDDEVFLPDEAAIKRYSPVYSPETGRVKIKLIETPKPKTPMLVTRSRSNAGAYITTPNLNIRSTSANGQ